MVDLFFCIGQPTQLNGEKYTLPYVSSGYPTGFLNKKQMRYGLIDLSEIADNVVLANLPMVRVFSLSIAEQKKINQTIS